MRKRLIALSLAVVSLLFFTKLHANTDRNDFRSIKIDSLQLMLRQNNDPITQIDIFNEIAWKYYGINKDSSLYYVDKALKINTNQNYLHGAIKSYNTLGANEFKVSNYIQAKEYFERALNLCNKTGDKEEIAKTANNVGIVYQMLGNYEKSIEFNLLSLKSKEELGDTIGILNSYINIASLYYNLDKFEEGIEFCMKGLELIINKESDKKSTLLNTIGSLHTEISEYEKAIDYLNQAVALNLEKNNKNSLSFNYQNLANTYLKMKKYDIAKKYFNESLLLKKELNNDVGINKVEMALGILEAEMGNHQIAIRHLEIAKEYFIKTNQLTELRSIYEHLASSYAARHDHYNAYNNLEKSYQINDSIYSLESKKIIEELETKYETEKKEVLLEKQQIALSKAEAAVRFYIAIILIIIISSIIVLWFYYKKQKSYKKLAEKNYYLAVKSDSSESIRVEKEISIKHRILFDKLQDCITTDKIYTDTELSIDNLAKQLGTNRTELSETIHLMLQTNYPAYISELRVNHAIRLLSAPNQKLSISGIGAESGFKSESNFYKQFKLVTGMSPSELKKQLNPK